SVMRSRRRVACRGTCDPRLAWQPAHRSALPGPLPYWASTGLVLLLAVFVAVIILRLVNRSKVGTVRRRPLGVDARARFPTARELRTLAARRHAPGRFPLGRHGRLRLATELPPKATRRRRHSRH